MRVILLHCLNTHQTKRWMLKIATICAGQSSSLSLYPFCFKSKYIKAKIPTLEDSGLVLGKIMF